MGNSQPYTKSTMYIKTIDIVLIDVENDQKYIQIPKLARKLTILTLKAQIYNINNEISVKNICYNVIISRNFTKYVKESLS